VLFLFLFIFVPNVFLQGFTINGRPVLNSFLKVKGTFETSIGARVFSPPTVLLHLHHHSIKYLGHFTIVEKLLSEYYSDDNPLNIIDIPFNVGHDQAVKKWSHEITNTVARLSQLPHKHVIVFITTHSHPDNGDLWLGLDENDERCATTVRNVSATYHFIQILTMNSTVV
jgi:hypothetical protein